MKKLAIVIALVALAGAPAFATTQHPSKAAKPSQPDTVSRQAYEAYAYAPGPDYPQGVYAFGQYQGADPDSFIRLQLMRDPPTIQF